MIIIDRGRLVKDAPLAEVTEGGVEAVQVRSPNPDALIAALAAAGINADAADGGWVRVSGAGIEQIGRHAADAGVPIYETKDQTTSLEDIFLALTDHHHASDHASEETRP